MVIMHAHEKSDKGIVLMKSANKDTVMVPAEPTEGRPLAKGNSQQTTTTCTQRQGSVSNGLVAVRKAARADKDRKFTALLHHVTPELLWESYYALKRGASPGIDGVTWEEFGRDLSEKLHRLHARVHAGAYRAQPAKRIYLPKPDGSQRPISIQCLDFNTHTN